VKANWYTSENANVEVRNSLLTKVVRGKFSSIFGLRVHDYWISATEENNPLYPPFLRGNPSGVDFIREELSGGLFDEGELGGELALPLVNDICPRFRRPL
jgi:hypothetical protein